MEFIGIHANMLGVIEQAMASICHLICWDDTEHTFTFSGQASLYFA